MTNPKNFTVYMHPELIDSLDEGFSPMDGLVAINDLFVGLPLQHCSREPKCNRWRAPRSLRVYRGRFSWYPELGFSYVEIADQLHVIELWFDAEPKRHQVDVILEERMPDTLDLDEVRAIQSEVAEAP
jgi:hypothetical protein